MPDETRHRPGGPRSVWAPRKSQGVGAHALTRWNEYLVPSFWFDLHCLTTAK
jgi:hypothetical protein